jgi:PadR family transcriptional regulator, regulatory protein PadR
MKRDQTQGNLDVLLLGVLSSGPAHGYAVIAGLKQASNGLFDLPEGTVYPSLHRLEDAGLLASEWDTSAGRRRRVYRLTAHGATALTAGAREWRRFSTGMNAVLGATA